MEQATRFKVRPAVAAPTGITLLEAYSALASKAHSTNTALDIPGPGASPCPCGDADFWHLQFKTLDA